MLRIGSEPSAGRAAPFLRSIRRTRDGSGYEQAIPAVAALAASLAFAPATLLVGNNGSGKSTIVEALAITAGFNPEGGSRGLRFSTFDSHSDLASTLTATWQRRPQWGWFLRAETFYGLATYVANDDPIYGTKLMFPDMHAMSHGESFLDIIERRFSGAGLYLLDEPESALSFEGQLRLLRFLHDGISEGAQFIIATHSPLLMSLPGAAIYELDTDGIHRREWNELTVVDLWRRFLTAPDRFLDRLLDDSDGDGDR